MPLDSLDPTWINASGGLPAYDSEELRRDMGFLLTGDASADVSRSGVLDIRALLVTLSGSNVQVNPGGAAVGTGKGAYLTGATVTATIDALVAADATNPRRDRVVLEILDPDNGGGAGRKGQFRVIAGTPSATAASGGGYPAAPASPSITLAYVDVPKSGNGSPSVTDQRPFTAAAGAPVLANLAERDAMAKFDTLTVRRRDVKSRPLETWDATDAAWYRGGGSAAPATGAGWTLTGVLNRTIGAAGSQVAASFKAIYGGGTFSLTTNWVFAFTLTNAGFLPQAGNDAYGYFMLRSNAVNRPIKADCAFTIDSTGAVYIRILFGQANTTIAAGDEFSFNTNWNV